MQIFTLQILTNISASLIRETTKSVLINTSQNLINYSHTVDVLTFDYILTKYFELRSKDVKIFSDDTLYYQYKIYEDDFIYELTKSRKANKIFYRCTLQDILLVLKGTHPHLDFNKYDNVLIYLCGHGSKEFLKIHDKTYLLPGNISESIIMLSKIVNKLFIILDTCHAEAIMTPADKPGIFDNLKNTCIFVTSLSEEESFGVNLDEKIGVYKIDEFMNSLLHTISETGMSKIRELKVVDFFNLVAEKTRESTHKFLKAVDWKMKDFFLKAMYNESSIIHKLYL
ncbi:putative GPI-anchor transamidase [Cucumispora dikerogammari]|nr:putative GPI-anchor transamidase [Cucumispora dikerogammari]